MRPALGCLLVLCVASLAASAAGPSLPPAIQDAFRIGTRQSKAHVQFIGFDGVGNVYLAGTLNGFSEGTSSGPGFPVAEKTVLGNPGYTDLFVLKVSPDGKRLDYVTELGSSGVDTLGGMAVSSEGNVFLAGKASAGDFPITEGSFGPRAANGSAFVLKLDPTGKNLVYSTFLDQNRTTEANALAIDSAGNAYVGGSTHSDPADGETFPTTPGAYMPTNPNSPTGMMNRFRVGFVVKISPDGKTLVASTLFGGSRGSNEVTGIAVDTAGVIHIVGRTDSNGFPTTAGAFRPAPAELKESSSFLARLDNSASQLIYSTLIDGTGTELFQIDRDQNYFVGDAGSYFSLWKLDARGETIYAKRFNGSRATNLRALAVLEDGSVVLGGDTDSQDFPTRDTLQPCAANQPWDPAPASPVPSLSYATSGVLMELDTAGNVLHSSLLGGAEGGRIKAVGRAPDGALYLAGESDSPLFPGGEDLITGPSSSWMFAFELDMERIVRGRLAPSCLVHSATIEKTQAVPGSFSTIWGSNLGPVLGVSFQLGADGRVPTELAGVTVTVAGIAAPLLYVQGEQINFLVPQGISSSSTELCVNTAEERSCMFAYVRPWAPAIFPFGAGYAVLNQDWSLNTPDNPAPRGSVVALWGAGFGPYQRTVPDGSLAELPLNMLTLPVSAFFHDPSPPTCYSGFMTSYPCPRPPVQAEVTFAGAAPYLVNGATQVNVRIPDNAIPGSRVPLDLHVDPDPGSYIAVAEVAIK
jgi:uncharacterized protein (TIGR03437 family)